MAFSTGGGGGLSSDINVTPMIDILLVLLIIFMAITPVSPKGLEALVPQPPKNNQPQKENDTAIVVSILHGAGGQPAYKINETDVQKSDLAGRLQTIFSTRATKVMFIKADKDLDFAPVANAIDIAKGAGVDHVGLITPKIAAGQ
ncbi:MAG TPA: biopolymer transporter ExbD [Acidobacteriaceae bacterium]|jgi:biopolymer transport protein ExbD|nr:biopolymer transporter ExbD [Acidobacteriaceae bacterium]